MCFTSLKSASHAIFQSSPQLHNLILSLYSLTHFDTGVQATLSTEDDLQKTLLVVTHTYKLVLCTTSYKYPVLSEQNGAHQKCHTSQTEPQPEHSTLIYPAAHSHAVQSCYDLLCKDCPQHCQAGRANLHCSHKPIWHTSLSTNQW